MDKMREYEILQFLIDDKDLTKDDISALRVIQGTRGFQVYQRLMKKEFAKAWNMLRYKGKVRTDFSYGRINGRLDGIDLALTIVDDTLSELDES